MIGRPVAAGAYGKKCMVFLLPAGGNTALGISFSWKVERSIPSTTTVMPESLLWSLVVHQDSTLGGAKARLALLTPSSQQLPSTSQLCICLVHDRWWCGIPEPSHYRCNARRFLQRVTPTPSTICILEVGQCCSYPVQCLRGTFCRHSLMMQSVGSCPKRASVCSA